MRKFLFSILAATAMVAGLQSSAAVAQEGVYQGMSYGYGGEAVPGTSPWHSGYYHVMWGKPLALVVPPTCTHQTNWGWGVGNTRITPIYPQFVGPQMATTYGGNETYRPTPYYVSDTLQFGVYYIRGPW